MSATIKQCASCPWRVSCVPERDIPNGYSVEKHAALKGTIAYPGALRLGAMRVMACHYSPVGAERACAGWLSNQLDEGNNIGARLAVMSGRLPAPEVEGEQHARFEDTLPKTRRSSKKAPR